MIPEVIIMKRILALGLCLLSLLLLAACGHSEETFDDSFVEAAVTNPAFTEPGTIPYPDNSVTIKVPLTFLKKDQRENLSGWAEARGFYSAEIDEEKGVAVLVMSDLTHRLLLTNVGLDVIEALYGLLDNHTFPYFKGIETYDSSDFSELVILVDGNAYMLDPESDVLPQTLAQTCMVYQGYTTEKKYSCRVLVKDEESGGAVKDETYTQTSKDFKK